VHYARDGFDRAEATPVVTGEVLVELETSTGLAFHCVVTYNINSKITSFAQLVRMDKYAQEKSVGWRPSLSPASWTWSLRLECSQLSQSQR
jgi:hypothetical protein